MPFDHNRSASTIKLFIPLIDCLWKNIVLKQLTI